MRRQKALTRMSLAVAAVPLARPGRALPVGLPLAVPVHWQCSDPPLAVDLQVAALRLAVRLGVLRVS